MDHKHGLCCPLDTSGVDLDAKIRAGRAEGYSLGFLPANMKAGRGCSLMDAQLPPSVARLFCFIVMAGSFDAPGQEEENCFSSQKSLTFFTSVFKHSPFKSTWAASPFEYLSLFA